MADKDSIARSESHIDLHKQYVIMSLVERGVIANDVLKLRKIIEF